jgi:hypothetical protein
MSVGQLGPEQTQGLKLANEWGGGGRGCVKECGDTKKKQQSITRKLSCHKVSAVHTKACEKASLAKKNETAQTLNVQLQGEQYTALCRTSKCIPKSSSDRLTDKKKMGWRSDAFYGVITHAQVFVILLLLKCKRILLLMS